MAYISCDDDKIYTNDFTKQQIEAKSITGTWINPDNIKTPDGVPKSILNKMRLILTVDENGNPARFYCEGAPSAFRGTDATWNWNNNNTNTIVMNGISPINTINIDASVKDKLKVWFETNWADTEGNSGKGVFEATLTRAGTN